MTKKKKTNKQTKKKKKKKKNHNWKKKKLYNHEANQFNNKNLGGTGKHFWFSQTQLKQLA